MLTYMLLCVRFGRCMLALRRSRQVEDDFRGNPSRLVQFVLLITNESVLVVVKQD